MTTVWSVLGGAVQPHGGTQDPAEVREGCLRRALDLSSFWGCSRATV